MYIIAHRGASGYAPENTIAAFDLAVKMNADMIELDVQLTKDRQIVVIHDDRVDRTTNGSGFVKDFTLEELQKLDAGSWYGPAFQGERIPTLEAVLKRYHKKIGLLIELKGHPSQVGIEEEVGQLLGQFSFLSIILFNPFSSAPSKGSASFILRFRQRSLQGPTLACCPEIR